MTGPRKYIILHLLRIHTRDYGKRKIWWMWRHVDKKARKLSSGESQKFPRGVFASIASQLSL